MSDKTKKIIDPKPIRDLTKILDELNLTELSYSNGDLSIKVAKGGILQSISNSQLEQTEQDQNVNKDLKNDPGNKIADGWNCLPST